MRWLKGLISVGLILAAVAVLLSTAFSDHSDDYGQVSLPQGGAVELPKGTVTVFLAQLAPNSDPIQQQTVPFDFQVTPSGGGPAVPISTVSGETRAEGVERSVTVGELGAIAKLKIPAAGGYMVNVSTSLPAGTSFLKFGTNAGAALASRWKLLAGLLGAAILLTLIPMPRGRRHWEDDRNAPTGWSSDPRSPYAG